MDLSKADVSATAQDAARLSEALLTANGKRKARLLSEAQVLETVREALTSTRGFAVRHGGEANDGTQRTTLCLAVRDGPWLTVGIGLSGASGAGPGRTWKELQPWSRTDDARNGARLMSWAKARGEDRVRVRVKITGGLSGPAPARSPSMEAKLFKAVLASPDSDAPRVVFADLCSERADPRGEFITLQLGLAREPDRERQARADALEKQHGFAWNEALSQFTLKQRFHRGFVEEVELRAPAFVTHAQRLFELAPITSVRLRAADAGALRKIASVPELARVRRLSIDRNVRDEGASTLAASPHLRGLKELECRGCGFTSVGYAQLLAAMPALEVLHVRVFVEGLAELIAARPRLRATVTTPPSTVAAQKLVAEGRVSVVTATRR